MNYTFFKKLAFSCILLLIATTSVSAQDAKPDLSDATILCDKRAITIASFNGAGTDNNEANTGCLKDLTETNTTWFTWEVGSDGFLSFNIQPEQAGDLFSFSLFELPNGLSDGTSKAAIRCAIPCRTGAIGLRDGDNDFVIEDCAAATDGFQAPLDMEVGKFYGLMIENATSDGGFTITFDGDGEFVGPVGDIMPDNSAVCFGEVITFGENITFDNGNIIRYNWKFEDGEDISLSSLLVKESIDFTFQSNGTKKVELTVVTSIGCNAVFEETVTINDCCNSTNQITIEDNPVIEEIACPDDTNGAIDITVTTTSAFPPIYAWSNNETTQDISMLPPDIYSVTVSNAAGCKDSLIMIELEIPNALDAVETVVNPSCGGLSDGTITIAASGGTAPYTYDFGDGNISADNFRNGLDTGDYEVIVEDASGCKKTIRAIELDEKQLNITAGTPTDPTCFGLNDGSIDITAPNAVGALTFDFNDGNGPLDQNSITTLGAGNYVINVFDSEGCTGNTVDFTLIEPEQILSIVESRKGISCTGANDGTAIVTATGGVPDYTYEWSTGSTERSVSDLGPGTYTVTITDANNCQDIRMTAPLVDPEVLTASIANFTDVSCSNKSDGNIDLTVNGGIMPYKYTYDGSAPQNGTSISDLSVGTYNISVTDNNDCLVEVSSTISSPANLSFDVSSTSDICYGESLTLTNTSTFTQGNITDISWNFGAADMNGASVMTSFTTIGKPTVALTITTDLNCVETLTEELAIEVIPCCDGVNDITTTPNTVDPLCNGGSNGTIDLDIISAAPIISTNWGGGDTEQSISNLSAGDYTVTITNDATCTDEQSISIGEPSLIQPTLTITEPTCDAANNGKITVNATGGTLAYTFDLGDGIFASNMTADNLGVGNYTIRVRDNNNCIVPVDTFLAVPMGFNPITASLNIIPPSCDVATNGSITVTAMGDGRPLLYDFGDGLFTDNIQPNLGVGPRTVIVQDLDNCTLRIDTTLAASDILPIQATVQIGQPSCTEATNGRITILASGNGAPFQYDFGNGFTNRNDTTGLTVGNRPVSIRDADNCRLDIDTFLSVSPDAMPVKATLQIVQPSCGGVSDGSVTILPAGELGTDVTNYTYDFGSGFFDDNVAPNLGNGQFFATVKNANNCSIPIDTFLNELVLAPAMPLVIRPTCFGLSDGSIVINVPAPGQGPFTYNLNDGNGFQGEEALNNLPEGTYTVQVQDDNLCLSPPLTIPVDQPDELMLTLDKTDISCFGEGDGRIVATVTGGVGNNNYTWSDGQITSTAENLIAGDYTLDVTDGNDCPISSQNAVTIIEPAELSAEIGQIDNVLCFGEMNGAITVNPIGGSAPYEYSLDGIIFQPTPTLVNLVAGDYTIIVKDSRACEITTQNTTVDEPGEFIVDALVDNETTKLGFAINLSAEATTTATGGINYTWSTTDSIVCTNCQQFETVPPGSTIYTVTAVNSDNCQANASVSVAVSTDRPIYFPNLFTPNGDGVHDEFYIPFSPAMEEIKELKIFDRSGALVFEAFNIKRGEEIIKSWDGEYNGTKLRQGVFVVSAQISFVDKQILPYQSDITIITSE